MDYGRRISVGITFVPDRKTDRIIHGARRFVSKKYGLVVDTLDLSQYP